MPCPLCGHPKAHKHGPTSKGSQLYHCPNCNQTFTDTFDTLYYRRQITREAVHTIIQFHGEGRNSVDKNHQMRQKSHLKSAGAVN